VQIVRRTSTVELSDADPGAVRFLEDHLRRLRGLPAHGNRRLCYHHLFVGLLLSFFNPVVRSLRLIESCGDFDGKLDRDGPPDKCPPDKSLDRMAKSTTADALAVFDPEHLKPVIEDLHRRAGHLRKSSDSLRGIAWKIVAGDESTLGTYLTTLASVAWALKHRRRDGKVQGQVRLNVQMDVSNWTPQVISVSGDDGSEPQAFSRDLLSGVLYVFDRNFLDFKFLGLLLEKHNHFVLRVKDNAGRPTPAVEVLRTLPLTAEDASAGVVSDQIVRLTGRGAPSGEFRLVVIHATDRKGQPEVIRLLTDLTDRELVSAKLVGEIYRERWQIELFFKWLKTWAGLDHLLSTSRNGITFQFYVAVIAVLLMYVQTGRRVSRYAIACFQLLLHGQITAAQMMATLEKLEREKQRARERAAARRAAKKLV